MLLKTHLAVAIFSILFMIEHVTYKFAFVVLVLVATVIPDIDSGFSTIGRQGLFRPVQMFTKHRGLIHSFTLCLIFTAILVLYFPIYSLPFFLGYGLHLLLDSFTVDGIKPFWPLRYESKGLLRVGSAFEQVIFLVFCGLDLIFMVQFFI